MPHGDHRHGPGHNHALRQVAAWELPREPTGQAAPGGGEPDFDLVERSFIEAADGHSDPTSLIRLANIAFTRVLADGRQAHLLGFTVESGVTVGSVTPGFAGQAATFHPIPAQRVERHKTLRFRYWTPAGEVALTLEQARAPSP